MGMAASQARYLSLFARKSNLEYQAQQINQERSVLSQQCTAMYNSLLAMNVPTPPSTSDFTTLTYSGVDGATQFTIGNVKPSGNNYCVEIRTTATGNALNKDYGIAACEPEILKGNYVENIPEQVSNPSGYYVVDNNGNIVGKLNDYATKNENGSYDIDIPENYKLFHANQNGSEELYNGGTLIAGKEAIKFTDAKNLPKEEYPYDWAQYEQAIRNTFTDEKYKPEDFMVYFERNDAGITTVKFALIEDVNSQDGFTETYSFISNGQFTQAKEVDQCTLEFDSQGMIVRIGMPHFDTVSNELLGYTYIDLTAEKTTDNAAYQDAYNEYEYAQYEYDKKQQEINAKTEVIQQQDRNLELKLQRLDTERQQITAEIDALKTVIKDNVDKSFKTFSG